MQVAKYDDQLGTNETHFSLVIKVFVRQMLEEITTFNEINDKQYLGVTLIGIMQLNHVWTFGLKYLRIIIPTLMRSSFSSFVL
jgi:hypothetical protein